MPKFEDGHRKVSPGRETTGTDWYTVLRYDPIWQQCDLAPASTNQRGILKNVPIACNYGGAWETQIHHDPRLERIVRPAHWGECDRGPRWGIQFPVQEGDMARVSFAGENCSDPVIVSFLRWRGDYGMPWMANRVLAYKRNDYTEQTPEDDDLLADRFDVVLPSGAWLRSTESGSWTIATAPVHRPIAWASLGYDGKIKIKSRDDADYKVHMEFDPVKQEGRIVIGTLPGVNSFIEFKDGDIRIRAANSLRFAADSMYFDCMEQGVPSAAGTLTKLTTHTMQGANIQQLLNQAVGQLSTASGDPFQARSVVNNPEIAGSVRNKLSELASQPNNQIQHAVNDFKSGMDDQMLTDKLVALHGADVLSGQFQGFAAPLDLMSRRMVQELGIDSNILGSIPDLIGGNPIPTALNLAANMTDSAILSQVAQFVGSGALNGNLASVARNALMTAIGQTDMGDRVMSVLSSMQGIITPAVLNGAGGNPDWIQTTALQLGRSILNGNDLLGGAAQIFNRDLLAQIPVDAATRSRILTIADQIEQYVGNPYPAVDTDGIPPDILNELAGMKEIPIELRDAIADLPQQHWGDVPKMAADPASFINQQEGTRGIYEKVAQMVAAAPEPVKRKLETKEVLGKAGAIPNANMPAIVRDPNLIRGLPAQTIRGSIGNSGGGVGIMQVRTLVPPLVTTRWIPNGMPPIPTVPLQRWTPRQFHPMTQAPPIQRFKEYRPYDIPNPWKG